MLKFAAGLTSSLIILELCWVKWLNNCEDSQWVAVWTGHAAFIIAIIYFFKFIYSWSWTSYEGYNSLTSANWRQKSGGTWLFRMASSRSRHACQAGANWYRNMIINCRSAKEFWGSWFPNPIIIFWHWIHVQTKVFYQIRSLGLSTSIKKMA